MIAKAALPFSILPAARSTGHDPARLHELDGLWGLAIILVLVWHYIAGKVQVEAGTAGAYALRLIGFTWTGVDIFFVLSGFLVGGMLMRNRSLGRGALPILIRRLFRIVPLYAASLAGYLALRANVGANAGGGLDWLINDAMPVWTYVAMVQNFTMASSGEHGANWLGITWSLALELQFYLLLAALVTAVDPRKFLAAASVLVSVSVVARVWHTLASEGGGFAGFLLPYSRMDSVLLGVMAASIVAEGGFARRVTDHPVLLGASIAASFVAVIALCAKGQGIGSFGMNAAGHLLVAVASALLIVLLVTLPDGKVRRMFRLPILLAAGTVSYGIYVLHQPVAGLMHHALLGQPPRIATTVDLAVTASALLLTVALAWLSWHMVERPLIQLGYRLTRTRTASE